jgi:hypothetical protein
MKSNIIIVLLLTPFLNISCDHGLAPSPGGVVVEQGIKGKIYYKGNYPTDLTAHKLIASKIYRKFHDINELINLVLASDSISIYSSELPFAQIDSINYRFKLQPTLYKYITIAQARGEITNPNNWKIVGVYDLDTTTVEPTPVNILSGEFRDSINIYVDYNHLPPQPFDSTGVRR